MREIRMFKSGSYLYDTEHIVTIGMPVEPTRGEEETPEQDKTE